ncbi:MAG TPA: hypothetical protein V6D29_09175 [Leptolyngbyaceae cyanobacterium]
MMSAQERARHLLVRQRQQHQQRRASLLERSAQEVVQESNFQ